MRCDEVAALLPSLVDGVDEANLGVERHVQECLRCQTDLVRYRKLVRNLELLRTRYVEPTPGLLGDTLAALDRRRGAQRVPHHGHGAPARVRRRDRRHGGRDRGHRADHRPDAPRAGSASPAEAEPRSCGEPHRPQAAPLRGRSDPTTRPARAIA